MGKTSALVLAAAVLGTAGVAHAQGAPAAPVATDHDSQAAAQAAMPWYERFTTSTGLTEHITGLNENDRALAPTWALNQRWAMTVNVGEAQRTEHSPDALRPTQHAAVGAYYQFTPRVRVGGEVSLEAPSQNSNEQPNNRQDQPNAGVRLESAFRF